MDAVTPVGVNLPAGRAAWTDGGGDRRARYDAGGIGTLLDQPPSGRPPQIDEIDAVVAVLAEGGRRPARLGVTHWSARLLAEHQSGRSPGHDRSTVLVVAYVGSRHTSTERPP
jgi:hypothetical protein